MELPYTCDHCSEDFDLAKDLNEKEMNQTLAKVLQKKFGARVLCPKCRLIVPKHSCANCGKVINPKEDDSVKLKTGGMGKFEFCSVKCSSAWTKENEYGKFKDSE